MPDDERTDFGTAIPLRDKGSGHKHTEEPNPYSRLEAVAAVGIALGWLEELLGEATRPVPADELETIVRGLRQDLHEAVWSDLPAITRIRRRPRYACVNEWRLQLDIDPV